MVTASRWTAGFVAALLMPVLLVEGCRNKGDGDPTVNNAGDVETTATQAAESLLLHFSQGGGLGLGYWELDLFDNGRCRVFVDHWDGTCAGIFECKLDRSDWEELFTVIGRAQRARLKDKYSPPKGVHDYGWCKLTVRRNDGTYQTSSYPDIRPPRVVRPLYDSPSGRRKGHLVELVPEVLRHPKQAITLSASTDKSVYSIAYNGTHRAVVTVELKNIGIDPVAVPSLDCREVLSGCVVVMGVRYADEQALADRLPTEYEAILESFPFGGDRAQPRQSLTSAAIADLSCAIALQPGEQFSFLLPPLFLPLEPGICVLHVNWGSSARYALDAIEEELGIPLITGYLVTTVSITIKE